MPTEAEPTEAIEDVVRRVLGDVSTSFPGTIVASKPEKDGLVTVQPNHKYKVGASDKEITPAPINNVVLMRVGGTSQTIERPPKESLIGSKVLCVVSQHSLTEWRSSKGSSVYPSDDRQFDENDAVAILGLYPETLPWPNPQLPLTWEFMAKEGVKFKMGTQQADLPGLAYQILLYMSAGVDPSGQFLSIAQ